MEPSEPGRSFKKSCSRVCSRVAAIVAVELGPSWTTRRALGKKRSRIEWVEAFSRPTHVEKHREAREEILAYVVHSRRGAGG
jgi:hypothetical protein